MKLNKIAVAGMMLVACSTFSNFASADTNPCTVAPKTGSNTGAVAATFVNTCKPSLVFVVAGSSALAGTITNTIKAQFDGGDPILVRDMTGPWGNRVVGTGVTTAGSGKVKIFYGLHATSKKPMAIYYQSQNGSAAGVSILMGKKGTVPEAEMIDLSKGGSGSGTGTCSAVGSNVDCPIATSKNIVADLAISDVAVSELLAFTSVDTSGGLLPLSVKLSKVTETALPMQGFGIAVSKPLFDALQKKQYGTTACPTDTGTSTASYTEACQPSITRMEYATLVSKKGNIKSVSDLVYGPGVTLPTGVSFAGPLTIARRDEASGTQATSQMFFNGSGCSSNGYTSADTTARRANDTATITGSNLVINEGSSSSVVETLLDKDDSYAIGILPLSAAAPSVMYTNATTFAKKWRFVKLDGVSPDLSASSFNAGVRVLDDKVRANMISGAWPLQVQSYAYQLTGMKDDKKAIATALVGIINNPTNDIAGLGYPGTTTTVDKKSTVAKASGNCSPLIKIN